MIGWFDEAGAVPELMPDGLSTAKHFPDLTAEIATTAPLYEEARMLMLAGDKCWKEMAKKHSFNIIAISCRKSYWDSPTCVAYGVKDKMLQRCLWGTPVDVLAKLVSGSAALVWQLFEAGFTDVVLELEPIGRLRSSPTSRSRSVIFIERIPK